MGVNKKAAGVNGLITEKARVLKHFGLTDKDAVKEYLKTQLGDAPDTEKTKRKLDTICNHLITKRLEGDYTFVKKG